MTSTLEIPAAELVSSEEYVVIGSGKPGDLQITERFWNVPLDYANPTEKIRIFGRSAVSAFKGNGLSPIVVYLQGGPGFECSSPKSHPLTSFFCDKGYQVLYLDQRGTGLSSAISADTVLSKGSTPEERAQWLTHFRADSIVKDCEAIRKQLLCSAAEGTSHKQKWTIVGQSFGGFAAVHYLSYYPNGLREVYTTGGMPPLINNPDPVYAALYQKVAERNATYYRKFPKDVARVRNIVQYLTQNKVTTPNGGNLTARRFLQLGIKMGQFRGIDDLHEIVLRAATELEVSNTLSYKLLHAIESEQSFDSNLLYAIAHETIYTQHAPADWSAHRLRSVAHSSFNYEQVLSMPAHASPPIYFTGEMVFPWMFDDYAELAKLKEVAEVLAHKDDWPTLYNVEALRRNTVPVNSAVYMNDMYVVYDMAKQTADTIGNHQYYVNNQIFHDGVRTRCHEVMGELWRLNRRIES